MLKSKTKQPFATYTEHLAGGNKKGDYAERRGSSTECAGETPKRNGSTPPQQTPSLSANPNPFKV